MKIVINILFILTALTVYSQNDSIEHREYKYEDLNVKFEWNNRSFFGGSMEVLSMHDLMEGFKRVYSVDSFYSYCDAMILADLNGDGKNEAIFLLSTGALMYDYNMCIIFDRAKDVKPLFEVHNAYVVYEDKKPLIEANIRLSPNVLGRGFLWQLEYKNGKMVFYQSKSKNIIPDDSEYLDNMKEYKSAVKPCEDKDTYMVYFEAYATQSMIAGKENKGWDFFDKNYNCSDKTTRLIELKKAVKENWKYIIDSDYKFIGNNR